MGPCGTQRPLSRADICFNDVTELRKLHWHRGGKRSASALYEGTRRIEPLHAIHTQRGLSDVFSAWPRIEDITLTLFLRSARPGRTNCLSLPLRIGPAICRSAGRQWLQ